MIVEGRRIYENCSFMQNKNHIKFSNFADYIDQIYLITEIKPLSASLFINNSEINNIYGNNIVKVSKNKYRLDFFEKERMDYAIGIGGYSDTLLITTFERDLDINDKIKYEILYHNIYNKTLIETEIKQPVIVYGKPNILLYKSGSIYLYYAREWMNRRQELITDSKLFDLK